MLLAPIVLLTALQAVPAPAYDPLHVDSTDQTIVDLTIHVASRNRDIPIRVYLPAQKSPQPVVLYSHGLGGSRETSEFLGKHWAERGYVAVFMQHPGSDESIWANKAPNERMAALSQAANLEQFLARVQDVPDVIDAITRWNVEKGHALMGRMDLSKIGMSGHSFGAITTQAVSGQTTSTGRSFTDSRIRAAVIFSPSAPKRGDIATAFASVKIPWMLMTGTKDVAPIGTEDVESRLKVFPALPAGHKYELVLDRAQHSVFTDRALPGDEQRDPKHHPAIEALSTAFWDAYLRGDAAAQKWLDGAGPRSILAGADRWQTK